VKQQLSSGGFFKAHSPGFVEGDGPVAEAFDSVDGLLALDTVQKFLTLSNEDSSLEFYRLSINAVGGGNGKFPYQLMAEYNRGHKWFVVGYVSENQLLSSFTAWEPASNR